MDESNLKAVTIPHSNIICTEDDSSEKIDLLLDRMTFRARMRLAVIRLPAILRLSDDYFIDFPGGIHPKGFHLPGSDDFFSGIFLIIHPICL